MRPLSPSQYRVLSQLQHGAKAYYIDGHDGHWFLGIPGHPGVTRQMQVLIKRGLVLVTDGKFNRSVAIFKPSDPIGR
jgi:hypothetical protein